MSQNMKKFFSRPCVVYFMVTLAAAVILLLLLLYFFLPCKCPEQYDKRPLFNNQSNFPADGGRTFRGPDGKTSNLQFKDGFYADDDTVNGDNSLNDQSKSLLGLREGNGSVGEDKIPPEQEKNEDHYIDNDADDDDDDDNNNNKATTDHNFDKSDMPTIDNDGKQLSFNVSPMLPGENQEKPEHKRKLRLTRNVLPTHYKISIIPYMDDRLMKTHGHINITVICRNTTGDIVLNMKDIDVDMGSLQVIRSDGYPMTVNKTRMDEYNEMFVLHLNQNLEPNDAYYILMTYYGKIRNIPNGLYRSYFINLKTDTRMSMVNTLFSPTFARYVYPCFDEPSFKAKFTFSIGRASDMFSLSNMKIGQTEPIAEKLGWFWDHYMETPQMSTYLTAFLVAPVNSLEKKTLPASDRIEINLWVRPDNTYQTDIALEISEKVLKFFENYFGIKFPLKKIDIVAVPVHNYEAMENWGLIIFKEGTILIDKGNSVRSQQQLAFTLAHELAHQWFGNLVTPRWWDDLWLKEGFSSYFQYLAIDNINPSWEVFNEFTFREMNVAFSSDALASSHPMNKLDGDIFNVVSYHKSPSLIRMLNSVIGPKTMQDGLRAYLKHFSYSNAEHTDLWNILDKYNGGLVNLTAVMDIWIRQSGYPVITVTRDYKNSVATVTQERFLLRDNRNSSQSWYVPLSYTTKDEGHFDEVEPKEWLFPREKNILYKMPKNDSWLYVNLQSSGYYIVNYDVPNWINLINDFTSLPPETKAQLIRDSFYLARAEKLPYEYPLSMAAELSKETGYLPWKAASHVLLYLRDSLIKMPAYGNFRSYVLSLVRKAYNSLLIPIDDSNAIPWIIPDDAILQLHAENIINLACMFQDNHCVANTKLLFSKWMNSPDDGNVIPVAIRPLVYCTAIREGGRREWEFTFDQYLRSLNEGGLYNAEKINLITALGCSTEQWLLTRALGLVISESTISKQEGMILFRSVAGNNVGQWIATSFIQSEWKRLLEIYNTPNVINQMVRSFIKYINSPYEIEQLKTLVKAITNHTNQESDLLVETIEMAENNKMWMEVNYGQVHSWLEAFVRLYNLKY